LLCFQYRARKTGNFNPRKKEKNMYTVKAKVQVKNTKNEVIGSQDYDKIIFEGTSVGTDGKPTIDATNPNAVSELLAQAIAHYQALDPKGNAVVDMLSDVTYAHDLGRRSKMRAGVVTALAGPDKAIDKQVKDFMAARLALGKPVDEATARARVQAMLAAD
jgi:hypothetical protein